MAACSHREIMTEVMGHLSPRSNAASILANYTCIPCMMPLITSQFLRRSKRDRPLVIPERSNNLGFLGQLCDLPEDVVFTVDYSIRLAQTMVYSLLGLERTLLTMYEGIHDMRVLLKAFATL
jgi:oleate hydratase